MISMERVPDDFGGTVASTIFTLADCLPDSGNVAPYTANSSLGCRRLFGRCNMAFADVSSAR